MSFLPNTTLLKRNSVSLTPYTLLNGGFSWLLLRLPSTGYSFAPITVKFGVNGVCNARCQMCDLGTHSADTTYYKNLKPSAKDLDVDLFRSVIDSLRLIRPKIVIDAAEPLLYRPLPDMIRYIKQSKMQCWVQTNGLLLETLAESLVDSGLDAFGISIDGTAEVHNKVRRVPEMYERIFSGIHKILELKQRHSLTYPAITINYVISEHSQKAMVPFVQDLMAMSLPIKGLNFYHQSFVSSPVADLHNQKWGHLFPVTTSNCSHADPKRVDCAELFTSIEMIKRMKPQFLICWIPQLDKESTLHAFYHDHLRIVTQKQCIVPWFSIRINPDGAANILSRCFDITLGNIEERPLLKIFNDRPMQEFRKILKTEHLFPACTRCCGIF